MHNLYTNALGKLLEASHKLKRALYLLDNGESSQMAVEQIVAAKIAYHAYMKAFDDVPVRTIETNEAWLKVIDSPVISQRINNLHNGMELVDAYTVILNGLGANFAVKPGDFLDVNLINKMYGYVSVAEIGKWQPDILKGLAIVFTPGEDNTASVAIHVGDVDKYLARILPKT